MPDTELPNLMPYQLNAFNNDVNIADEFLKLKDKFRIKTVIETGTALGGTTEFLAENFEKVITIEIIHSYQIIAKDRLKKYSNIVFALGDSMELLPKILKYCSNRTILYLDAHFYKNFPLLNELSVVKASGLKPVIVVHDCKNPDMPELGFDIFNGIEISFKTMKPYIKDIYGEKGYEYYYNTGFFEKSAKRGVIYITPKGWQN